MTSDHLYHLVQSFQGIDMDLVTQNLIAAFKAEESLSEKIDDPTVLEHFVNYCAISNEYGEEFDVEELHTGGPDDLGIDGIAVIVNGTLVLDEQEVRDLVSANKYIEANLIFCQSKSGGFSGDEISNTFFGLKDLLASKTSMPRNAKIAEKERLIKFIYGQSALFKRGNPSVKIYYATTGKWQGDPKLIKRVDFERDGLMDLDIFESVVFVPVDAKALQRLYSNAKNRFSKSIEFASKITLPELPGVQESYLGYLPSDEFMKLISDDSGNMLKGLFYDNVRDFQGDNDVNMEIQKTLEDDSRRLFVLMNNGVTVVADSIQKTGNRFTLEGYQVVNGCQTSNVLFLNHDKLEKVQIPFKLIVSQDGAVKNKIIKATNRQTTVKTEELTSLTDFQKSLEDYYEAVAGDSQLYYERRSQQFRTNNIEKIRIVTIPNQIRAFASMFLGLPHQASRYYGALLNSIESKIFVADHPPVAYYASALALYRLESLFRRKVLDTKYRPFKYHLLPIARIIVAGDTTERMNSNKFEKYCEKVIASFTNDKDATKVYAKAVGAIDSVLAGNYGRDKAKDATLFSTATARLIKTSNTVP